MQNDIRVGIVGAGYMAEEHIKVFTSLKNVIVTGIFSKTIDKCITLSKRYKITNICKSIDELYDIAKPNLLVVCVPELECKSICINAFKYDWKILIEKPVGFNCKQAKEILDMANLNNCKAYVGLNRRHYSSTNLVKKIIEDYPGQRLINIIDQEDTKAALNSGQPKKVVENWMYANSIHLIDYFNIFCRGKLENVEHLIDWEFEKTNFMLTKLNFSSGDIGIYQCYWNAPGPWSVAISNNKIRFDLKPLEKGNYQLYGSRDLFELENDKCDLLYKPGLYCQAKEAIKAANNKAHKLVSIDEGYRTMELVRLIYNLNS